MNERVKLRIKELLTKYEKLPNKEGESEKRTEDFLKELFDAIGWDFLSKEVVPQGRIRGARTTRVDYSFKRSGDLRPSFYLEAKRFSDPLENPAHITQAVGYGKNSGTRWVVLTNFLRWRVFNSNFFDELEHAEMFEFTLTDCLQNPECLDWLLLFSRENGPSGLDEWAKKHKKWKESADIEDLLTEQLLKARKVLSKAIREQNLPKFDTGPDQEQRLDECVQHIIDRIIFCRMLEDTGADTERRLRVVIEKWERGDKRKQFYRENLCEFWHALEKVYDSDIFDLHRIDRLSIKNEDFIPVINAFYFHEETGLAYRFEAIQTDILGHAYENYLAYRVTVKRKGLEEEQFYRKQAGIYYTPEFLVDFLVSSTLGELLKHCSSIKEALQIRVLDPACGSGTFLVRALEEFRLWFNEFSKKNNYDPQEVWGFLDKVLENCMYGIDIDPRAVNLTQLNLFLRAAVSPRQLPRLRIIERDSLVWDEDIKKPIPFVFERDLPLVSEAGGFDVVIGNPPWEKWKFDSQEFFEPVDPGFKSLPAQAAKKRADELLKKRPGLRKSYIEKTTFYDTYSELFRSSYQYQAGEADGRAVSGDLDLYKLFTERAYQLLKEGGRCGFVIPSGIYTDLGAKGLRMMLFDHAKIKALYSFENRGHAIFPDVHASYKPILLVFEKCGKTTSFPCAFFLHSSDDLKKAIEHPTVLDIDFIKRSSPTSWGVLEIKTPQDYAIVKKLLKFPRLGEKLQGVWNVDISRGFDMTNDSHLFRTECLNGIPLLEGKNMEQFTHQWKEAPRPRYKVLERDIEANLKPEKRYDLGYWMAYRLIASSTNYRTFICTVVPPGYVCGNSLAIVRLSELKQLCFLVGVMNSFVVDYFLRQKVSANINMFYFLDTPVPRLTSGKEFESIVRKVAQLVSTTNEFRDLKKETNVEHGVTNEAERARLRAQLDAAVAKLYGITKDEMAHILGQFPLADQRQKEMVMEECL